MKFRALFEWGFLQIAPLYNYTRTLMRRCETVPLPNPGSGETCGKLRGERISMHAYCIVVVQ